jgi:hypothetical protein
MRAPHDAEWRSIMAELFYSCAILAAAGEQLAHRELNNSKLNASEKIARLE